MNLFAKSFIISKLAVATPFSATLFLISSHIYSFLILSKKSCPFAVNLEKLIEMYDKGLLTDEEFIAMKKKIN